MRQSPDCDGHRDHLPSRRRSVVVEPEEHLVRVPEKNRTIEVEAHMGEEPADVVDLEQRRGGSGAERRRRSLASIN